MKKLLIGTTALVGALMVANTASAQTAPELKVGMDMRFWAHLIDDDVANAEDREFRVDYRMPITVSGKTDSGLTYGGYIRVRTSTAAVFNNTLPQPGGANRSNLFVDYGFVHVGGAFGKLEFGDNDGPLTITYVAAPIVGALQINAAGNSYPGILGVGNFNYGSALYMDQTTRVNYYTPVFAGFQGAIGFAPELGSRGLNMNRLVNPGGSIENAIEAAVVWNGKFDPVTIKASAGIARGEARNPAAPAVGLQDLDIWQAGINVGFGPFTVGGGYFDNNDSRTNNAGVPGVIAGVHDDETGWNVGASWKQGPIGVAASYGQVTTDYTGGQASTDDTMYGIGVNYVLAPGLHLDGDLLFFDSEAAATTPSGNEGNMLVLRTRLLL